MYPKYTQLKLIVHNLSIMACFKIMHSKKKSEYHYISVSNIDPFSIAFTLSHASYVS